MEDPPEKVFSLTNVFPAFRTALAAPTDWPGVLLWKQSGDSVFLPFSTESLELIKEQAHWIFSHLATALGVDLQILKEQYRAAFKGSFLPKKTVTILHVSDIHLGSREAGIRLTRVQDLLANLVDDLGEAGETIIPLVSGDLMDSPDEDNLDRVRSFLSILNHLGTEEPIILLGNHDVRNNGYLADNLRMAMQIDSRSELVRCFDKFNLAIACFDSVRDGKLARGHIGERQFLDMGSALDTKCKKQKEYMVVAALHHHPIPVTVPDWYARPFYEKIFGDSFDRTEELEDANDFIAFVEQRRCAAILHGHKHIPRIDHTPQGIPVIGCGSTVGKVKTRDKRPFMSINLLTIDTAKRKLSARLLAERIPGAGAVEYQAHEIICGPQPARTYHPVP